MLISLPLQTTWLDYPDNNSLAILVYTVGCEHNCIGCHNQDLQKISENNNIKRVGCYELEQRIISMSKKHRTNKVVFLGGEPLYIDNVSDVWLFTLCNKKMFDICIYTGYNIDTVKKIGLTGFKYIKCGKFDKTQYQKPKKTDDRIIFASKNQKLYDYNLNLLSKDGVYKFKYE